MQSKLPPPFIRQMQALLGPEWPLLEAALQDPAPVSIRLNPKKASDVGHFNQGKLADGGWILDASDTAVAEPNSKSKVITQSPIPWHPQGYYLSDRPVFTLDPSFHAGAYYVQEASSMFIYEALRQVMDFDKPLKILDLCAAPGGKSTLLADMMNPASLLVSNETIRARTNPLRENLERWGSSNIGVTSAEVEEYTGLESWFDLILADAPCSGEGLFRKDPDAMREWSLPQVEFCAGRQRRILAAAVTALAPGGILLFSTCTYNEQENAWNAEWLCKNFELESIALKIPAEWGITQTGLGYQFYPHKVRGEGFYLAVFRKKQGSQKKLNPASQFKSLKPLPKNQIPQAQSWLEAGTAAQFFLTPSAEVLALPAALEEEYLTLDKFLKTKWFGTPIGEFKGKDFVPNHALALSLWISKTLPALDLSREQALLFLKKETFEPPAGAPQGWVLARYQGLNLGWLKILPNRLNNYLPQERRIRMSIG